MFPIGIVISHVLPNNVEIVVLYFEYINIQIVCLHFSKFINFWSIEEKTIFYEKWVTIVKKLTEKIRNRRYFLYMQINSIDSTNFSKCINNIKIKIKSREMFICLSNVFLNGF